MGWNDPVSDLPNIGKQRQLLLAKLNIFTIGGLIEHFPRDYQDRSKILKIAEAETDEYVTIKANFTADLQNTKVNGKIMTKGKISDGSFVLEVIWFNQPYLKNTIKKNAEYIFCGKITEKLKKRQLESPDFEIYLNEKSVSFGRIIPIYPSTYGLSQKMLRNLISVALNQETEKSIDYIPPTVALKYGLMPMEMAIFSIHFPEDNESFFKARKTLVFTELFTMQLALLKIKDVVKSKSSHRVLNRDYSKLLELFPFELTNAQTKVVVELQEDLGTGYVMNRLIQGDVGSGKTAIAMIIAYLIILENNENQVALMAPTEVLARQLYHSFKQCFDILGIKTILLTGELKKKEKEEVYLDIKNGKYSMVIGTHALIQEKVVFRKLAIAITDEQHRFGVRQRAVLAGKGVRPHVMVMTATPIPRTLALILYGDLDISTIDSLPPGRIPIETYGVGQNYRERIYKFLKEQIDQGRQIYVICPTIEKTEENNETEKNGTENLQSVLEYSEKLKNLFKGYQVACLHGKLKQEEKQNIMTNFELGAIDIIVSTTVIEVGINVPNATVMLIEDADRFGLSQLHQLRGRVGRGVEKSFCILISDSKSQVYKERMKAMTRTNNGFTISELDLKLRGPGDFFGTLQHGLPEFKMANLFKDIDILKDAQKASLEVFTKDRKLKNEENVLLCEKIDKYLSFEKNSLSL